METNAFDEWMKYLSINIANDTNQIILQKQVMLLPIVSNIHGFSPKTSSLPENNH